MLASWCRGKCSCAQLIAHAPILGLFDLLGAPSFICEPLFTGCDTDLDLANVTSPCNVLQIHFFVKRKVPTVSLEGASIPVMDGQIGGFQCVILRNCKIVK